MAGKIVTAVIGVGNEYRRDDGVGLAVVRRVREAHLPFALMIESIRDGAALIQAWEGAVCAFVVDCMVSGAPPGTILRWDARAEPLPAQWRAEPSTHAFDIARSVELARTLDMLPPTLVVYGIEGIDFSPGAGLTPAVETAAQEVAMRIINEIRGVES